MAFSQPSQFTRFSLPPNSFSLSLTLQNPCFLNTVVLGNFSGVSDSALRNVMVSTTCFFGFSGLRQESAEVHLAEPRAL